MTDPKPSDVKPSDSPETETETHIVYTTYNGERKRIPLSKYLDKEKAGDL